MTRTGPRNRTTNRTGTRPSAKRRQGRGRHLGVLVPPRPLSESPGNARRSCGSTPCPGIRNGVDSGAGGYHVVGVPLRYSAGEGPTGGTTLETG